jgi:hypothetical protein
MRRITLSGDLKMKRKWTGLPKRFSEESIHTLTIVGCTSVGSSSVIPILYFAPGTLPGFMPWAWLMLSFLLSLAVGLAVSQPLLKFYRSFHGELTLQQNMLNVRWALPGKEIVLNLDQPVDVDACWFGDARRIRGGLHANIQQNGRKLTLYADTGTAHAGARLGLPQRKQNDSTWHQGVRLHPTQLTEILELIQGTHVPMTKTSNALNVSGTH